MENEFETTRVTLRNPSDSSHQNLLRWSKPKTILSCTIVNERPKATTEVTVPGTGVFKTREKAQSGMKTLKVCESN